MDRNCQSCGMPLKKDPAQGGTDAGGNRSEMYCSFCYQDGLFIQDDFTAEEMQVFCIERMKEAGFPASIAWLMTRHIPKLKRWASEQ